MLYIVWAVGFQGLQYLLRGALEVCNVGNADAPLECWRLHRACQL